MRLASAALLAAALAHASAFTVAPPGLVHAAGPRACGRPRKRLPVLRASPAEGDWTPLTDEASGNGMRGVGACGCGHGRPVRLLRPLLRAVPAPVG